MNKTEETIDFAIHPAVIRQLIENQAGTLSKAVLEGAMNGIDAMAGRTGNDRPRVDITLALDHVIIRDNGRGFASRDEILDVFRVFGLPQTTEKTYGRFRIGRGQLFAQGQTTYTSGRFRMHVDYRKFTLAENLGFKLSEDGDYGPGVTVRVDFYDDHVPVPTEQQRVIREIRDAVRYVRVADVYLNGEKLNTDPADQGWTLEDDTAYFKLTSQTNYRGVVIYNNGVYVETFSSYEWGINGVVVSKKALPVNQARNQIQRASKEWKHIEAVCREHGGSVIRKKTTLSDHEAEAVLKELALHPNPDARGGYAAHGPSFYDLRREHMKVWGDIGRLQIWPDVTGRRWSANQLKRVFAKSSNFKRLDSEKYGVAFATNDDPEAVSLHENKLAFVFDQSLLSLFDEPSAAFVEHTFKAIVGYNIARRVTVADTRELAESLDRDFRLLEPEDLTKREALLLDVFHSFSREVACIISTQQGGPCWVEGRRIRIGLGSAEQWTDGETYIALNQEWLKEHTVTLNYSAFEKLAHIIFWQYCYASLNVENSHATENQRDLFLQLTLDYAFGAMLWQIYVRHVQKPGNKPSGEVMKRVKEMQDVSFLAESCFWEKDEEPLEET